MRVKRWNKSWTMRIGRHGLESADRMGFQSMKRSISYIFQNSNEYPTLVRGM
jgi:hypothetical protein